MGRFEHHVGGDAGVEGLLPALGAQTPSVAGRKPVEAEGGLRGAQVVAPLLAEGEEFGRDPCAHHVRAKVVGPGVAAAVAIKAGERIVPARLERSSDDVGCHRVI